MASHGLAAPTVVDVREAVRKVSGSDFEETWARVCRAAAALAAQGDGSDLDVVEVLVAALRTFPGFLSVVGSSMQIRLSCHRTLSNLASGGRDE